MSFDDVYQGSNLYYPQPTGMLVDYVETYCEPGFALDAGCGDGRNTLWLLDHGWRVDAIDISGIAVEKLQRIASERGLAERLNATCGDLASSFYRDVGYDLIVASTLLCHVRSELAAMLLARFLELLRPKGVLYISVFTEEDPSYRNCGDDGASVSDTSFGVINHYGPNALLQSLLRLKVVRYFEGVILDKSHGEAHWHGIARAVGVRVT